MINNFVFDHVETAKFLKLKNEASKIVNSLPIGSEGDSRIAVVVRGPMGSGKTRFGYELGKSLVRMEKKDDAESLYLYLSLNMNILIRIKEAKIPYSYPENFVATALSLVANNSIVIPAGGFTMAQIYEKWGKENSKIKYVFLHVDEMQIDMPVCVNAQTQNDSYFLSRVVSACRDMYKSNSTKYFVYPILTGVSTMVKYPPAPGQARIVVELIDYMTEEQFALMIKN